MNKKNSRFHYTLRNIFLKELGYKSYKEYLQSQDWKSIRDNILKESPNCILCENKAVLLHHTKYDISALLGLRKHVLASLCYHCHEKIEFEEKDKNGLSEANSKLFTLARKTKLGKSWLKAYHKGLSMERLGGQRERNKRVTTEILKKYKPWENSFEKIS